LKNFFLFLAKNFRSDSRTHEKGTAAAHTGNVTMIGGGSHMLWLKQVGIFLSMFLALSLLVGINECGGYQGDRPVNWDRPITANDLSIELRESDFFGDAWYLCGASSYAGCSMNFGEIGMIDAVYDEDGGPLLYEQWEDEIHIDVPASTTGTWIQIKYLVPYGVDEGLIKSDSVFGRIYFPYGWPEGHIYSRPGRLGTNDAMVVTYGNITGVPVGSSVIALDNEFPIPNYASPTIIVGKYSSEKAGATKLGTELWLSWMSEDVSGRENAFNGLKFFFGFFQYMEDNYGKYPYGPSVWIVAIPEISNPAVAGMESHRSITMRYDYISDPSGKGHELGHGWWAGNGIQMSDWNLFGLTNEGLLQWQVLTYAKEADPTYAQELSEFYDYVVYTWAPKFEKNVYVWPETANANDAFSNCAYYRVNYAVEDFLFSEGLSADHFMAGLDLYWQRYQGQAASADDLFQAIIDGTGKNFEPYAQLWLRDLSCSEFPTSAKRPERIAELENIDWASVLPGNPQLRPDLLPLF